MGKPLYRQCFHPTVDIAAGTQSFNISLNIADVDVAMIDYAHTWCMGTSNTDVYCIPYVHNDAVNNVGAFLIVGNTDVKFAIRKGTNTSIRSIWITLTYTTTSVLEAGALVQCHDGAALRLSHALLLGENPRMSLFDEIRNATLAHPHRCGDFDAAARRFDAQIQVFDGFARQVQMDAINIQRLPGGSGPNGFRRTGLRSGGLTTAIRHASHSRTTADNDGGPPGT